MKKLHGLHTKSKDYEHWLNLGVRKNKKGCFTSLNRVHIFKKGV